MIAACKEGNSNIVQSLLKFSEEYGNYIGINIYDDRHGMTPLHFACLKGNIDIVKMLLDRSDITKKNIFRKTAIHQACKEGQYAIVILIIKYSFQNQKNLLYMARDILTIFHDIFMILAWAAIIWIVEIFY